MTGSINLIALSWTYDICQVLDRWYRQQVGDACIVGVHEGCKSVGEISLKGTTSRFSYKFVLIKAILRKKIELGKMIVPKL